MQIRSTKQGNVCDLVGNLVKKLYILVTSEKFQKYMYIIPLGAPKLPLHYIVTSF